MMIVGGRTSVNAGRGAGGRAAMCALICGLSRQMASVVVGPGRHPTCPPKASAMSLVSATSSPLSSMARTLTRTAMRPPCEAPPPYAPWVVWGNGGLSLLMLAPYFIAVQPDWNVGFQDNNIFMTYLCTFTLYLFGCSHPCSLHIFWPREHFLICFVSFVHVVWPCGFAFGYLQLMCLHDVEWAPILSFYEKVHKTQHGLLFCPPFPLAFLARSPTHSCNEATSCGLI